MWQDPDATATGSYAPVGQAVAVDGGYRLNGTGSFCSGCDNAQWQLLGGMIPQPDGTVKPGFFLMPTSDLTIDDNWHTMGLAGTGSKNIVARDVFVPAHRAVPFAELLDATAPGMRGNPNPLYRQSFLAVLPIAIVSPVLGMAEGALADFLAMAGVRTTRGAVAGGNRRMAELTTVQLRVAEASGLIDAARLLMQRDLAQAFATAARGEPIGVDMRLRNRRDQAFCVRLLVQAIDALVPGRRRARVVPGQAAAAHLARRARRRLPHQPQLGFHGSMYGQSMLGLEPRASIEHLALRRIAQLDQRTSRTTPARGGNRHATPAQAVRYDPLRKSVVIAQGPLEIQKPSRYG